MGTGYKLDLPITLHGFRYLQGYMGTKLSLNRQVLLYHLDTFKDIWEPDNFHDEVFYAAIFRYLQGYMGTSQRRSRQLSEFKFRYLQGYMGTSVSSQMTSFQSYLDTFKDIWERYQAASTLVKILNLDTFKDIWERERYFFPSKF